MYNPRTLRDEEPQSIENYQDNAFIIRIEQEYDALREKTNKLMNFLGTEKFQNIDRTQQILLHKQLNVMINYLHILELRLLNLGGTPFSLSQIEYVEKFCGGQSYTSSNRRDSDTSSKCSIQGDE